MRCVSANAVRRATSVPTIDEGSGKPQCAVTGWPGHTGQTSAAALSQTVNTKSSLGASRRENSSHDFERNPSVGYLSWFNRSSAKGCTWPLGMLPALYSLNLPALKWLTTVSAMIERAELCVHRNKMLNGFLSVTSSLQPYKFSGYF